MNKRLLPLLFVSLHAFAGGAYAASFDCAAAKLSSIEQRICASPELSGLDSQLAQAYAQRREGLAADQVAELKQEQVEWLKGARNACADDTCLRDVMAARLEVLRRPGQSASRAPLSESLPLALAQSHVESATTGSETAPETPVTRGPAEGPAQAAPQATSPAAAQSSPAQPSLPMDKDDELGERLRRINAQARPNLGVSGALILAVMAGGLALAGWALFGRKKLPATYKPSGTQASSNEPAASDLNSATDSGTASGGPRMSLALAGLIIAILGVAALTLQGVGSGGKNAGSAAERAGDAPALARFDEVSPANIPDDAVFAVLQRETAYFVGDPNRFRAAPAQCRALAANYYPQLTGVLRQINTADSSGLPNAAQLKAATARQGIALTRTQRSSVQACLDRLS